MTNQMHTAIENVYNNLQDLQKDDLCLPSRWTSLPIEYQVFLANIVKAFSDQIIGLYVNKDSLAEIVHARAIFEKIWIKYKDKEDDSSNFDEVDYFLEGVEMDIKEMCETFELMKDCGKP
jgi:hypothetical protein